MKYLALFLGLTCLPVAAELPSYDQSRARPLEPWKRQITEYSRRHYGEPDWRLQPRCIVLHYTAGRQFPWNLVRDGQFAGEAPGLASHFVVDGSHIWQLLPCGVRSRGAYGINHRAINIEMVAADAGDLMSARKHTMNTTARLVSELMREYGIPQTEIYSHQQVATMDPNVVPWVLDLVNGTPYSKQDPGEAPMRYILERVH